MSSQGKLWEILVKASAKENDLDVSSVYFEPEGDVFVAYSRNYELCKAMEVILNELISNYAYLTNVVNLSGLARE